MGEGPQPRRVHGNGVARARYAFDPRQHGGGRGLGAAEGGDRRRKEQHAHAGGGSYAEQPPAAQGVLDHGGEGQQRGPRQKGERPGQEEVDPYADRGRQGDGHDEAAHEQTRRAPVAAGDKDAAGHD